MKFLIASDLHGDLAATERLLQVMETEKADRLVLLGDLLYHGPRNDLPAAYNPKGVIAALNGIKENILAVRGNCDTEVDQMVLHFPVLADYAVLALPHNRLAYLTHGHRYNEENPMPMGEKDWMLHGHTHIAGATKCVGGQICLNPGSISMPKGGTAPSYLLLEDDSFLLKTLSSAQTYATFKLDEA